MEGFSVCHKNNYQEGLREALLDKYQLLVLDVSLPDGDGFSLCRELRKKLSTPVIFLTARSDSIDKIVGFELGADDYMTKPFSPAELVLRVKAIIKRSVGTSKILSHKDFLIEADKNKIYFRKTALSLSRYEYLLLKFLIERPGLVFSREQLMDTIWDDPHMSDVRTVDTHIKSLRAKLKIVHSKLDPIETHRGQGYSLKEKLETES